MHIPDGYLSPATCAALYAAAAPFWHISLQRVKRLLNTRLVPQLSLFAALSFVVMMFNLPLPGGTTGHATGVAVASIVLGPWAGMLAISMALVIQALFFGDGGITAIGANCFNIAIAGSLIAYGAYRLMAGKAAIHSPRRPIAAALSGYLAINGAALLTALEFGIQPLLYRDAGGAPLYAPYPLSIAIPAMMIGHLTIAGLAEAVLTGGVVAWLQRSDPTMLKLTAPRVSDSPDMPPQDGWRATKSLWIGLGALMIFTPLGLLATGAAWGEWGSQDFADPVIREEITRASGNQAPPDKAPSRMERLSAFWTAPIPDYAPSFLRSQTFGYLMSALVGTGIIIMTSLLIGWIIRRGVKTEISTVPRGRDMRQRQRHFVERSISQLLVTMEYTLTAEEIARKDGLLQRLDPRVKVAGLTALIVAAALAQKLMVIGAIFILALVLAGLSRVPVQVLLKRGWIGALLFTGFIALPAIFITPGDVIYRLPLLGLSITETGLKSAGFLIARVETAVTLSLLLVTCTPWAHVLKALRALHVPAVLVVILGMTYRYIFLLLQTAHEMLESRRSRTIGRLSGSETRRIATASVGVLLGKTMELSGEVYLAMQSRGFRGEVDVLDDFKMQPRDWTAIILMGACALTAFIIGG